ncbi:hypothetical protein E2320_009584 [Naja naja]|nr:hypothetical protein E2320_009584 [Naja naja]
MVYLIFLLILPLCPRPNDITMQGCTGHLFRTISYTSFIFLMLQVSFQIAFYYLPPNDFFGEEVLSHFGIVRFSRLDAGNIIHLLAPDIGMFLFGLTVMLLCRKTVKLNNWESELPSGDHDQFSSDEEEDMKETESEAETEDTEDIDIGCLFEKDCLRCSHSGFLLKFTLFLTDLEILCEDTFRSAGKVFIMLLLGSTGIILPSACSAVYFFTFLGLCTWWSWNCPISPVLFNSLCVFLAIFSAGHIIVLYLYQLPYFQDLISSEIIYVRILGIVPFIKTNIMAPWKLHIHPHLNWPVALNPFFLLSLYYLLVRILQQRALPAKGPKEEVIQFHSEDYVEINMLSMLQVSMDANGKVVSLSSEIPQECFLLPNQNHSSYSMDGYINQGHSISLSGVLDHNFNQTQHVMFHQITYKHTIYSETSQEVNEKCNMEKKSSAFLALAQFIANQSYVIVLITMMVWSITYNSWLTFVLLIWSCVIWMVHDRHLYALRSLPFLVTYGNVLILYQLTFWLLLKQYVMQIQKQKDEEFLKEVIVHQTEMDTSQNLFMEILGSIFKRILVKYWIYFCSIMFFIVSFNGKVVLYKILYVIFFLFCVALYQIHYEGWRRILKGFWLISVSYSMIVLIALYTYQFEMVSAFFLKTLEISEESEAIQRAKNKVTAGFMIVTTRLPISQYWKNPEAPYLLTLHIFLLKDLGLELFSTKELFTKIILPCAFLLVCIVQLHYFHKDFLNITDLTNDSVNPSSSSARYYMQTTVFNLQSIIEKISVDGCVKKNKWAEEIDNLAPCLLKIIAITQDMQVFAWRFLELHILKIVSTCTIWITLQEVCLMNYVFFIVWTFAIPYSKFRPYASRICTFWSCVMVICKMLYQLKFVKPWNYSSNCTQDLHLNITYRSINVDEFLEKSSLYVAPIDPALWIGGLMKCSDNIFLSLKNHLTILILMVLEATVYRHQYFYWTQNQILPPVTGSLFNNIAWENLDEGLLNCIKYCLNYSFYKFGVEICFVAAVNVIGQRMDLYALIHASWLTYLLSYRQRKAIAQVWPKYCFFLASIVAFQYLLCIGLPPALCQDYPWRSSHWLFPSNLIKWLYLPDFAERPNTNFLLCKYSLERVSVNSVGYQTLSIAARINIFCVGYFVACFYFMHFGQSLQLKPLRDILRSWDYLIAYTTLVITVKNLLAVGACAYLNQLQINYCWLIQTFAMYCTIPGYEVDPPNNEICELPKDEAGILWDAVCFTFLLIQRRVFMSHYYLYIVTDLKATDFLASRAAEMFELKLKKKVTSRMEENRKSTEIMKKQMDLIKPKFKNQSSCKILEAESDQKLEEEDPVIRSESYCLFDTDSEDEEEHEHSEMRKKELFKKKTAWQLAYEAWMRNTKSALNMREQDEIKSERNKKEKERKYEQLPGIERANVSLESSDENIEILASEEDLDKSESIVQRIINIIKLISILMHALIYGTIEVLNSLIKDNLDIANALRMEKHILWQQMNKGNEVSADMVLQHYRFENNQSVYGEYKAKVIGTEESQGKVSESPPTENTEPSSLQLRRSSEIDKDVMGTEKIEGGNEKEARSQGFTLTTSCVEPASLSSCPSENQESADSLFTRSPKANKPLGEISPMMTTSELLEQSDKFYQCLPCPLKLGVALYHVMVSTSEMLCYFVIIVNHMVSASILTLVPSILIFLWPMLSIPRPTKFFWMTAIIYTEITIVIKCISQFGFFPWSSKLYCSISAEAPFALPNLIGIEKKDGYAQYDLVQLLALFLHRYILKCQGLWDSKILDPKQKDMAKKSKKKGCKGHSKEPQSSSERWHLSRNIFKRTNREVREQLKNFSCHQFFCDIIYPESSPVCDIYVFIFIADMINFIITIFGYGAFGFGTMIIDRALYLRKNTFGKCVFQMILVFGIHIWMCFILPQATQRRFNRNRLAQLWYFVKFRIMPFLIELKAAMDWVWTDSTLSLSSWICLEDIYANIFILKCQRECEKKKKPIMKYGMGGFTIFLLVFIVWFPLLLMSFKSVAGVTNQPLDISVKITISGYESLFTMSAQQQNLVPFTHAAYNQFTAQYALYPSASYFIDQYSPEDIVIAKIKGNASLLWSISPGNRKAMIAELSNSSAVYVNFHWTLTRNASLVTNIEASGIHTMRYGEKEIRDQIVHMLSGTRTEPIVLPGVLPKYLRATNGADAKIANSLKVVWETEINLLSTVHSQKVEDIDAMAFFRNITIKLQRLPDKSSSHVSEWWIVKEQTPLCLDNRCSKNMEIIICNDKVSPSGLGFVTAYGIAGLYMSFVLVIGKFIRQYFNGLSRSIMFEELPNVDRILKLCTEIFLAREAGELELEEQLFAKLIFLYRSPETMIKWTRERKEK